LDESAQQRFAERSFRPHLAMRETLAGDVRGNIDGAITVVKVGRRRVAACD
jgi:hypothetical protein